MTRGRVRSLDPLQDLARAVFLGSKSLVTHGYFLLSQFFLIPFYLQAVQIHLANGVKLLEPRRGVLSSTPPYK
jgi:hypothetical protein